MDIFISEQNFNDNKRVVFQIILKVLDLFYKTIGLKCCKIKAAFCPNAYN